MESPWGGLSELDNSSIDWDRIPSSPGQESSSSSRESSPMNMSQGHSTSGSVSGSDIPPVSTQARFRGSIFLLTYAQCLMTKQFLMEHLKTLGPVTRLIVGREPHPQTGGHHLHAMVTFSKAKDVGPRFFDLQGTHPNIRIANAKIGTLGQSEVNMWNYVKKEDAEPLVFGEPPVVKRTRDMVAREALELAASSGVAGAMDHLRQCVPYETLKNHKQFLLALECYRQSKMAVRSPARDMLAFANRPSIPLVWSALYLSGPTGLGKTQFARSLLPEAQVIRHRDQLRTADFSKGVIFDDFEVSHWPPTAVIHLLDWDEESGIDVKHSHVVIPPHTRKIITSNKPFHQWIPTSADRTQYAAIERRVYIIEIETSLF